MHAKDIKGAHRPHNPSVMNQSLPFPMGNDRGSAQSRALKLVILLFLSEYLQPSINSQKKNLQAANLYSKSNVKNVVLFIESTDTSHQC